MEIDYYSCQEGKFIEKPDTNYDEGSGTLVELSCYSVAKHYIGGIEIKNIERNNNES